MNNYPLWIQWDVATCPCFILSCSVVRIGYKFIYQKTNAAHIYIIYYIYYIYIYIYTSTSFHKDPLDGLTEKNIAYQAVNPILNELTQYWLSWGYFPVAIHVGVLGTLSLYLSHGPEKLHSVFFCGFCWLYSLHNKVVGGYIAFTPSIHPSICPSIRPTSRVRSVVPTVLVGSISYLYILSSNFRRCDACKVACKILKLKFLAVFFFQICNFDFVLFWLGIWCESLVWVIMGQWGYLRTQPF